ncbi:MAG: hypothetical protein ACM3ML_13175 [Micromonosporaceae bacterium]
MFTSAFHQRAPRAWQGLAVAAVMGFGTILAAGAAAAQPAVQASGVTSATMGSGSSVGEKIQDVFHTPPGLMLRGETVTLNVGIEPGHGTADAYVRSNPKAKFTHLRMRLVEYGTFEARVPARLLTGGVLEDYVVVRDAANGKLITVPPSGARAPYRSWIVDRPLSVALGTHDFGHIRAPEAIVADATAGSGPGQAGFRLISQGVSSGPSSFDVARDGTVWVADRVNSRLLAYAPDTPGHPVRTVAMPNEPLELAIAPQGTIYVLTGTPTVYAFNPDGALLWSAPTAIRIWNPFMRTDTRGVPWLLDHGTGWLPLTDGDGHPLTVAQQVRQTSPYQPVGGGRVLVDTTKSMHEEMVGLTSRTGTLARTFRITSSDEFQSLWPQAMIGSDVVDMGGVSRQTSKGYRLEFLVLRISPTGRVLDQFTLDPHLSFMWGDFTRMRVGPDGHLYYLQTSPDWGMRVARYTLRGAPVAHTSPTPAPSQASVSPAPSTSHSAAPAAEAPWTPPAGPGDGGLSTRQWAGLSLGIATLAALAATAVLVWLRRRGISLHWPLHMGPHHVRPAR